MSKLFDRLNALDGRVLPKSRIPKTGWVFVASAAMVVGLGAVAVTTDYLPLRANMLMFMTLLAYRTGAEYEQYRAWRESGAEDPPPARRPDWAFALTWTALVITVFVGSTVYIHRQTTGIDPEAARAVVDTLVERSMESGGARVCTLAVSERSCRQILAQVPGHTSPRPSVSLSFADSTRELNMASFVLSVAGSPGCAVTVIRRDGELRVVNPVYWMGGGC